jgi:hypothetical protein
VTQPLAPEAWYEVYVELKPKPGSNAPPGTLPGVTFRTSRWRRPAEMLQALGFAPVAAPAAGDVPVHDPQLVTTNPDASDATFQQALTVLGLDGWPIMQVPRTSLLWSLADGGRWALAGLLVESSEPVDRPGRCTVHGVHTVDGSTHFDSRRSDRTRSRLLFVTGTPLVPAGASSLVLELLDEATGSMLVASLAVPAQPAFVEEP